MASPFERWTDRIQAASDPSAQRALLGELALWRAGRLSDIVATRDATFAISRLHMLLGDHESAVHEARSLFSLCETAPPASDEEISMVRAYLTSLGGEIPASTPKPRRSRRDRQREARAPAEPERRRDPIAEARVAAREGRWTDALRDLRGVHGARTELLRAWIQLSRALGNEDEAARKRDLADLEARLRRSLKITAAPRPGGSGGRAETPSAADAPAPPTPPAQLPDDPLSQLLGTAVSRRRESRLRAMDAYAEANPDQLDALAAAALEHHLGTFGPRSPAPWLVGPVGRALAATDGTATLAAMAKLREAESYAVTAYDEPPFAKLVDVLRAALAAGWGYVALRRGVAPRGEPADRKLWTLRLTPPDGGERLLAVGHASEEAYAGDTAKQLADRLRALGTHVVLHALGAGNRALAIAAATNQVGVCDAPEPDALLQALHDVPAGPEPVAESRPRAEPDTERRSDRKKGRALDEQLTALLGTDGELTADALLEVLREYRHPWKALRTATRALSDVPDQRVATVLRAVHDASDDSTPRLEGTTLALRAASRVDGGGVSRQLLTEAPTAARYGGPGIDALVDLATALHTGGWEMHRVLLGPTRRERDAHPALETLRDSLQGVWRLLVRKGEVKGEVWYVAELPPEGRAAVPQLLLQDHLRVVVLPIEPDLLEWYGTLSAPPPVGWTGAEGEAVLAEMAAWSG